MWALRLCQDLLAPAAIADSSRHRLRIHFVREPKFNHGEIEFAAPECLRNVIRIVTETGLRIYRELIPIKRELVDLENRTVWISDSKTPNGVADVPLSEIAIQSFLSQIVICGPGQYLFPNEDLSGHQKSSKSTRR
jgi:integrase